VIATAMFARSPMKIPERKYMIFGFRSLGDWLESRSWAVSTMTGIRQLIYTYSVPYLFLSCWTCYKVALRVLSRTSRLPSLIPVRFNFAIKLQLIILRFTVSVIGTRCGYYPNGERQGRIMSVRGRFPLYWSTFERILDHWATLNTLNRVFSKLICAISGTIGDTTVDPRKRWVREIGHTVNK
jgi:hypothetical protein